MSIGHDECERCLERVRRQGDHVCPSCAEFLGRDVTDPFWGDFASHPDAQLTECRGDPLLRRVA